MDEKGDNDFAIEVALVDDSIIVTLPGTHYRIVYRQGSSHLTLATTSTFHSAHPLFAGEPGLQGLTKRASSAG
jgi:hypothetical protein